MSPNPEFFSIPTYCTYTMYIESNRNNYKRSTAISTHVESNPLPTYDPVLVLLVVEPVVVVGRVEIVRVVRINPRHMDEMTFGGTGCRTLNMYCIIIMAVFYLLPAWLFILKKSKSHFVSNLMKKYRYF